jgi:hypothetical protein
LRISVSRAYLSSSVHGLSDIFDISR